jgi:hypothetical protein
MAEDNNAGGPRRNFGNEDSDPDIQDPNEAFLPADHPLMQRLQDALAKDLAESHEKVELEIREKENILK